MFYGYDNLEKKPSIYFPTKTLSIPNSATSNQSAEPMEVPVQNPSTHDPRAGRGPVYVTPRRETPIAPDHTLQEHFNQAQKQNQPSPPKTPRRKLKQKMRLTTSGLVYSGPLAILSHLYKAWFVIDNIPYNSVEQRLQSQKAVLANDKQAQGDIMRLHCTWEIKACGDRVKVTKEYIENRLPIANQVNNTKFQQNRDLMEFLLETEDLILIEGTTSAF